MSSGLLPRKDGFVLVNGLAPTSVVCIGAKDGVVLTLGAGVVSKIIE